MALGLSFDTGSASDIIPIVKFDARSGRIFRRDFVGSGEYDNVDITRSFRAVVDMENIEVGSIAFGSGAPQFALVPLGQRPPSPPSPEHKQGARMMLKLAKEVGGDIREIASTAKAFLRGLDELHNAYLAGVIDNPGKLPIVILKDTIGITTGEGAKKSTNYQPIFEITAWVARPADLVFVGRAQAPQAAPAPAAPGRAPVTGSKPATPPAPPPAASAPASADDFG
jgi:hypothetical protein